MLEEKRVGPTLVAILVFAAVYTSAPYSPFEPEVLTADNCTTDFTLRFSNATYYTDNNSIVLEIDEAENVNSRNLVNISLNKRIESNGSVSDEGLIASSQRQSLLDFPLEAPIKITIPGSDIQPRDDVQLEFYKNKMEHPGFCQRYEGKPLLGVNETGFRYARGGIETNVEN